IQRSVALPSLTWNSWMEGSSSDLPSRWAVTRVRAATCSSLARTSCSSTLSVPPVSSNERPSHCSTSSLPEKSPEIALRPGKCQAMPSANSSRTASRSPRLNASNPERIRFSFGCAISDSSRPENRASCSDSSGSATRSGELERAERLGVLHADLLPVLLGLHRQPLFEEAEEVALDLAGVGGQRLELAIHEAGDVLVVVRLVRPSEPHLRNVPRLEAFVQEFLEEQRVARAREDRVQRDGAGRSVIGVVEVLVAEEPGRGVARHDGLGAAPADLPRDVDPHTVRVLELAVVVSPDRHAGQADQAPGVFRLLGPGGRELGAILLRVVRAAITVGE